jgi:TrmH family RNA methyltransferase
MTKVITSLQNPLIKNIDTLTQKARERRGQGLFVAEGLRETLLALRAGYRPEALLYDPAFTTAVDLAILGENAAPEVWIETSSAVFEKIAYRSGVPNVVALLHAKPLELARIVLPETPLILVLESVEKPGNIGAILRSADAAGVSAVILCDPLTDWYNPNVIRASLGAVFTTPVATATAEATLEWLHLHGIRVVATHLEAAHPYYEEDFCKGVAIVMGAEAEGISNFWVEASDARVIIPMQGRVDSMNVSASSAVLMFEARRQRTVRH